MLAGALGGGCTLTTFLKSEWICFMLMLLAGMRAARTRRMKLELRGRRAGEGRGERGRRGNESKGGTGVGWLL